MNARPLLSALLLAALALPAAASHNRDTGPRPPPLRGLECLDPDFARSFNTIDDQRLLVDAGRKRYVLQISGSCWNLDHTPVIEFRGDPISERVCGNAFDAVLVRGGTHPCRIESMQLIDKATYKALLNEGRDYRRMRRVRSRD